jgi:hypothetical protein
LWPPDAVTQPNLNAASAERLFAFMKRTVLDRRHERTLCRKVDDFAHAKPLGVFLGFWRRAAMPLKMAKYRGRSTGIFAFHLPPEGAALNRVSAKIVQP